MSQGLYALVSEERMKNVLQTLQEFTGLSIQLIDREGRVLLSFGAAKRYCAILKGQVFRRNACADLHRKAGERAQQLGEAYIFSCHANLDHIAFPLISQKELLGSVIVGPFLMDQPDSTLVSGLAVEYDLPHTTALELYDELDELQVLEPARVNHLKNLIDYLLTPLLPSERALLLQLQEKLSQQSRINETIQIYKKQEHWSDREELRQKETELLAKVRSGDERAAVTLLNEWIGYLLAEAGSDPEELRLRAVELTTLLSRIAMDGGASTDTVYEMSRRYLDRILRERDLDELCYLLQDLLQGVLGVMSSGLDKGNTYVRQAMRYISDHYAQRLTLEIVAAHVHLSGCYFSTLFREVVGVSFREYLLRVRVEESKRLLLSPENISLTDIAISVGFPDQSYYCKAFKRVVGLTPGKYRLTGA